MNIDCVDLNCGEIPTEHTEETDIITTSSFSLFTCVYVCVLTPHPTLLSYCPNNLDEGIIVSETLRINDFLCHLIWWMAKKRTAFSLNVELLLNFSRFPDSWLKSESSHCSAHHRHSGTTSGQGGTLSHQQHQACGLRRLHQLMASDGDAAPPWIFMKGDFLIELLMNLLWGNVQVQHYAPRCCFSIFVLIDAATMSWMRSITSWSMSSQQFNLFIQ